MRNQPGMCWATILQATAWRLDPFFVARNSFVTNDQIGYTSALFRAVIETRAPLKEAALRCRYEGEGDDLVCIVYATFKGESEPREHRSPPLKEVRPPMGDKGVRKGSPLWDKKPALQLFYNTSRDWARMYCSSVVGGIYTEDDFAEGNFPPASDAVDITAQADELHRRLAAAAETSNGDGFVAPDEVAEAPAPKTKPPSRAARQARREGKRLLRKAETVSRETPKPKRRAIPPKAAKVDPVAKPAEDSGPPTTAAGYAAYLKSWLKGETDPTEVQGRWARERALRNRCNLTQEERLPLEALKNRRVEQLSRT